MTAETPALDPPGAPAGCAILLHGLGAGADDLMPLGRAIAALAGFRLVFPQAPTRPVTLPGAPLPAWYDIVSPDLAARQDEAGAEQSRRRIEEVIAAEKKRGFSSRQILLGGFSQGGALALYAGLRHTAPLAALVALSAYLLAPEKIGGAPPANRQTPIFIGHGSLDLIVPRAAGAAARDALIADGRDVSYYEYPIGHAIDGAEIADLNAWLRAKGIGV